MKAISNEFTSVFHFIGADTLEIGDCAHQGCIIDPLICPETAMNALISSEKKGLAVYDLEGLFSHQLSSVSEISQFTSATTLFVVAVGRNGDKPKESKVFKMYSEGQKAFTECKKLNKDYHVSEVFVFDCKITHKFKTMEDVGKVWQLYA